MKQFYAALTRALRIYADRQAPRSAAALSYYLTMTFFPLVIFLYALFGQSYTMAMKVLEYLKQFLTPSTVEMLRGYIRHVADSSPEGILLAAGMMLLAPASAALRTMESTIAEMQGGRRFRLVTDVLLSLVLAIALVAVLYFAIVVMLTGRDILNRAAGLFPGLRSVAWAAWSRYLLLAGIALLSIWALFAFFRRRDDHYRVLPGAALSTCAVVVMSRIFSAFISASTRYSLVYGSLTSLILLMFWLFMTCQMLFLGAAFNIGLRDAAGGVSLNDAEVP